MNVLEEFNNLQNLNNDKVTKLPRLDDEDIQYNSPSITKHASVLQTRDEDSDLDDSNDEVNEGHEISARLSQNTIDKYENELEDENEEEEDMKYKNIQNIDNNIHEDNETDEESEETGIEITEDSNRKSSLKDKASDFKDKSLPIFKIIINKVKIYLFSAIRNLGEAFSYIFSLIFRQGKKGGLSKALPNKRKGFLILSLIIFLVILLGLFIKSTNEENAKKQLEQSYKDKVAMVGTDISTVKNQYSTKVVIGDPDLKTKIVVLQDEVKNVEGSSLKDKLNEQTTIAGFYKTLADLQDRVDGIIRVGEEIKLAKYSGIIPNFAPSSITMRDGKIYFTDTANSTVSQFDTQTNNTNQIITKSASISNPISIDFAKNQLLLLDTQKGVSSIDVNAKTLIHIPGYDQVAPNATTLKTYYDKDTDNFYMLEPAKKQIDRMVSIGSGRYSSITKYNKDDLGDNLQDFSIIGGSAYTIDSTGLVKKYTRSDSRGAVQDTFSLPPLTIPIGMGAKIAGMIPRDQGNVYLFIADPANGRLLVFDNKDPQNGDKFLGQYMISTNSSAEFQDVFKNIKGIVVDDTSSVPAVYMILNYGLVKLNITIQ